MWTAAIASVTATGAWYGAGLKMKTESKQVITPLPVDVYLPPLHSLI